jgi:hypothetical protein
MSQPTKLALVSSMPEVAIDLWKPAPASVRLDRVVFAQGMALLSAAAGKEMSPPAYWLALAGFDAVDFVPGVQAALQQERFLTPAAVFDHVVFARATRREAEEAEARREQARRAAEAAELQARQREERRAQLQATVDGWSTPPSSGAEIRERLLVVAEMESAVQAMGWLRAAEMQLEAGQLVITPDPSKEFLRRYATNRLAEMLVVAAPGLSYRIAGRRA